MSTAHCAVAALPAACIMHYAVFVTLKHVGSLTSDLDNNLTASHYGEHFFSTTASTSVLSKEQQPMCGLYIGRAAGAPSTDPLPLTTHPQPLYPN